MSTTTPDHEHSTARGFNLETIAPTPLRARWGWLLAFGIVQVLAGACAITVPGIASFAAVLAFGWVLIVSSVLQIVHAFTVRKWTGFVLHLVGGILYAAAGVLTLLYPVSGVVTLTLVVAGLFLIDGAVRVVLGYRIRQQEGWGWFVAGGVASMVLGIVLLSGLPATAVWALGLLLGVNLVIGGGLNIGLALNCHSKRRAQDATGSEEGARG
jgi:uncharacterized membrane protein HdeD (DUF308 family)